MTERSDIVTKRQRGATAKVKAKRAERFLDALRQGYSVSDAAVTSGFKRSAAYDMRHRDQEFAEAWNDAIEEGNDALEDEALRRAVHGVEKPVYQGGRHVGNIREYSDVLLIFLLKARRPAKFAERHQISSEQVTRIIRDEPMTEEEWERTYCDGQYTVIEGELEKAPGNGSGNGGLVPSRGPTKGTH